MQCHSQEHHLYFLSFDQVARGTNTRVPLSDGGDCTIASKIKVTPKGVYLHISKLHSILAIVTQVKYVTAVKFHDRVLQLTVFLTISHLWG